MTALQHGGKDHATLAPWQLSVDITASALAVGAHGAEFSVKLLVGVAGWLRLPIACVKWPNDKSLGSEDSAS